MGNSSSGIKYWLSDAGHFTKKNTLNTTFVIVIVLHVIKVWQYLKLQILHDLRQGLRRTEQSMQENNAMIYTPITARYQGIPT